MPAIVRFPIIADGELRLNELMYEFSMCRTQLRFNLRLYRSR